MTEALNQPISHAVNRLDEVGITELFAELGHGLVEGSSRAHVTHAPDFVEELLPAENVAAVLVQADEKPHFLRGDGFSDAVAGQGEIFRINATLTDGERRGGLSGV